MQKLIEDNCIFYMCNNEVSILDLSNKTFMDEIHMKIITKLQNEENKDYISTLHYKHIDRITIEIRLINYYDKLLQRSSQYIEIWHERLNSYIQECESFSLIYDNALKLKLNFNFKHVTLNEFKLLIEKFEFQTLISLSRFCTDIVSDL